ncbi:MAG: nucleotidyltransferase family protein, partial [Clostridia bacterium]|nr:nucleotidyltransferase family protein [Clostridia bacterium]
KALLSSKSAIIPVAVKRTGANHDSDEAKDGFSSATNLRKLILSGDTETALSYIPQGCHHIFKNAEIHSLTAMEKSIIAELIKMPLSQLAQTPDVNEGIENRIKSAALNAKSLEELTDSIKTKRYTHSRIRRILLTAYLGITESDRHNPIPYLKILAHNQKGQELISKMKKTASLPIVRNTSQVNKLKNPEIKSFWERERIFDNLYQLFKI